MARTPFQKLFYTNHGEREHVLSFGLRSGRGRRNPYIIGRRRKAPGASHYHERHGTGTPLAGRKKKGARHARLLNEERKREKVRDNKRRSCEKKRHLKSY